MSSQRTADANGVLLPNSSDIGTKTLWVRDSKGRFVFPNGHSHELLADDGAFRKFINRIHSDDRHLLLALREAFQTGEKHSEIEYRIQDGIGGYRWVGERNIPQLPGETDATSMVSVAFDVTAHRNTSLRLRESEQQFRDLAEGSLQGVYIHRNWQLLYANSALAQIFGYETSKDLLALGTVDRLLAREEHDRLRSYMDGRQNGQSPPEVYTVRGVRKDGQEVSAQFRATCVYWNGEPAIQCVVIDATERQKTEKALRESDDLFTRVFQEGPTACAIAAPDDGYHYDVNERWSELLGYTREEALSNTSVSLGIWADPEDRIRLVEQLKVNGSAKAFETKFRTKAGKEIDILVSAVYAEFHSEPRLFLLYDDITKQKKAEEARQQSEQRFKDLVETTNVVPWEFDPETMRFTYIGPQAEEMFGHPLDAWYAENFWVDSIHPEDRDKAVKECQDAIAQGEDHELRYRVVTPDGRSVWVRDIVSVFNDDHGKLKLRGIFTDITERMDAIKQLADQASSMTLMRSIAQAANQSTDVESALKSCLEQICDYTGWEIGHVCMIRNHTQGTFGSTKCWHLSDVEKFRAFREKTEKNDCVWGQGMCGHVFVHGEARWVSDVLLEPDFERAAVAKDCGITGGVAFPITVRNDVVAVLEFYSTCPPERTSSLVDILTDVGVQISRLVERAAQKDLLEMQVETRTAEVMRQAHDLEQALSKEKDLNLLQRQFVSMASHEFRTPLAIIDSAAQRLKRKASEDSLTSQDALLRIDNIREAVDRMTRLMESTLSAARMEEGKIAVEIGPCNIGGLIRNICDRQREIAKGHTISSDLTTLPDTIQADEGALEQVFTNLLSNAVKYALDSPDIHVRAFCEDEDILVQVRDNGIGIDEDDLPKMFERFFRAKTSTGIAGTGIGLNLAKTLIEMHDGSIGVESIKGRGTTFTVRLPVSGPKTSNQAEFQAA